MIKRTQSTKFHLLAILSSLLFSCTFLSLQAIETNKTFLALQPHGINVPLELTLRHNFINTFVSKSRRLLLQVVPYTIHSQNDNDLGKYFGFLGKNNLEIGRNVDIDHRYLKFDEASSNNLIGSIHLAPRITIYGMRIDLFQQLSRYIKGLSLQISTHVIAISHNLGLSIEQKAASSGENKSIADFFRGNPMLQIQEDDELRNLQEPLTHGKINGSLDKRGISDIHLQLEYKILKSKNWYLNLNSFLIIPTTNGAKSHNLFEPILGTGGHWTLGAGLNGNYTLWSKKHSQQNNQHALQLLYDFRLYYLFANREVRILGLKNQEGAILNWGHFLLLGKKNSNLVIPAANVLAQNVSVNPGCQFQAMLLSSYCFHGLTIDVGYNFWFRQQEQVKRRDTWQENTYGFVASNYANYIKTLYNDSTTFQKDKTNKKNIIQKMNPTTNEETEQGFISDAQLSTKPAQSPDTFTNTFFLAAGHCWHRKPTSYFIGTGLAIQFPFNNAATQHIEGWIKGGVVF